jgi:hypothetical protein
VAERVKGDVTDAPFSGLVTVTLAREGAAHSSAKAKQERAFTTRPAFSPEALVGLQDLGRQGYPLGPTRLTLQIYTTVNLGLFWLERSGICMGNQPETPRNSTRHDRHHNGACKRWILKKGSFSSVIVRFRPEFAAQMARAKKAREGNPGPDVIEPCG